jgi:hypothetical protein
VILWLQKLKEWISLNFSLSFRFIQSGSTGFWRLLVLISGVVEVIAHDKRMKVLRIEISFSYFVGCQVVL